MKIKNTVIHPRLKIEEFSSPYFLYMGSKHHKSIIFHLFWFDLDIFIVAKDWMIKTLDGDFELKDGRKFSTYSKNPKYVGEKLRVINIPPIDGKFTFIW